MSSLVVHRDHSCFGSELSEVVVLVALVMYTFRQHQKDSWRAATSGSQMSVST